jgi:SAM-dependent methyltransferase
VELVETLREHERAWNERPLLRRIYRDWFELMASRLSDVEGPTVELGAGLARFREVVPDVVETDVEPTPWSDAVVDAAAMPYEDGSVANLALLDVYHHLADPAGFLDEARRVLAPGGRVVLLEPHCSPVSSLAYRLLHHEEVDFGGDGFTPAVSDVPLEGNIAQATAAFFRHADELARRWPELALVERRRLSLIVYPLSGGFSKRPLLPAAAYKPLSAVERVLTPLLAPVAAFRVLVVLERR